MVNELGCSIPTYCTGVGKTVDCSLLSSNVTCCEGVEASRRRDLTYGNIELSDNGAKIWCPDNTVVESE